jgi:lipid A 4'-phosphatase
MKDYKGEAATGKSGNRAMRQAIVDFAILAAILGGSTLLFRVTSIDITLERFFYSAEKGWMLQYAPFWDFIYRYGIFPGYFLAFAALVMISLSYWNKHFVKYRKASLVLVFTLVVGPGLIVNLMLKDHTGRPRPREITEFGGTETYLCVCEAGKTNEGKSFPCGHCSMGFYLTIPYLFYRQRKKVIAWSFLLSGILYGLMIGIARMMAGGHFASDVVWAGGLTWGVALAGYYLFRPDKPPVIPDLTAQQQKKRARRVTLLMGILLPVITIGLMLATPYFSKKFFFATREQLAASGCKVIRADLEDAVVTIAPDTCFRVDYSVNAFGFPNSKIRGMWTAGDTCTYRIQRLGWFTEVRNSIRIGLPMNDTLDFILNVNNGKVFLEPADGCNLRFRITIREGDLHLRSGSASYRLSGKAANIENHAKAIHPSVIGNKKGQRPVEISYTVPDGIVFVE